MTDRPSNSIRALGPSDPAGICSLANWRVIADIFVVLPTTPTPIVVSAGVWDFQGFLYLNAVSFQIEQVTGSAVTLRPPGELYLDADGNDAYDTGESWINLSYPATLADPVLLDPNDMYGSLVMHNDRGPEITGVPVSFRGILFTSGYFDATGTGRIYGSVIARQGVTQAAADGSLPTPEIYWDATIGADWPPPGWKVPRVVATAWITER